MGMSISQRLEQARSANTVDVGARTAEIAKQARAFRQADLAQGRKRGEELFGEGSLGRVEAERQQEISDLIERRRAEAQGFSPEEQEAFRSQNISAIQRAQAGEQRGLRGRQAQLGITGPLAAAQESQIGQAAQRAQVEAERDLFLRNIEARRVGLGGLEQSITGARADELSRQQFNIGQGQREKFGQIGTELGFAGLGVAERQGAAQQAIGQAQLAAGLQANGGKK